MIGKLPISQKITIDNNINLSFLMNTIFSKTLMSIKLKFKMKVQIKSKSKKKAQAIWLLRNKLKI